jgi:hypothetical protein
LAFSCGSGEAPWGPWLAEAGGGAEGRDDLEGEGPRGVVFDRGHWEEPEASCCWDWALAAALVGWLVGTGAMVSVLNTWCLFSCDEGVPIYSCRVRLASLGLIVAHSIKQDDLEGPASAREGNLSQKEGGLL